MDDIPTEKPAASEGVPPAAVPTRRDGRPLRAVGPESEVRGGHEAAPEPPPGDPEA